MKTLGIRGASVTIPFKIDVIRHLDDIDPLAARIGSVNTLKLNNGRVTGFNTDGYGAVLAIEQCGIQLDGKTCMVIGNGGSARAISFTLAERGATIIIAGRNESRIRDLAGEIANTPQVTESILLKEITPDFMDTVDIVINATSVGMIPDTGSTPLETDLISPRHVVFDIVYAPHETRLLSAARERGCRIVHGADMLVLQGTRQFEIWTGRQAPAETMRRAVHKHLNIES
jgi:shikimate dehydrogenase